MYSAIIILLLWLYVLRKLHCFPPFFRDIESSDSPHVLRKEEQNPNYEIFLDLLWDGWLCEEDGKKCILYLSYVLISCLNQWDTRGDWESIIYRNAPLSCAFFLDKLLGLLGRTHLFKFLLYDHILSVLFFMPEIS